MISEIEKNFKPGKDLIYGRQNDRAKNISNLKTLYPEITVTADQIINEIAQNKDETKLSELSLKCLNKYRSEIESEDEKLKSILKSRKRVLRFCKYIIGIPETIHFCLGSSLHGDLNIDRVLSKYNPEQKVKDNAFTTAELRYVYKHWDQFATKVKFYRDGVECNAPWVDNNLYWQENFKRKAEVGKPLPQAIPSYGSSSVDPCKTPAKASVKHLLNRESGFRKSVELKSMFFFNSNENTVHPEQKNDQTISTQAQSKTQSKRNKKLRFDFAECEMEPFTISVPTVRSDDSGSSSDEDNNSRSAILLK